MTNEHTAFINDVTYRRDIWMPHCDVTYERGHIIWMSLSTSTKLMSAATPHMHDFHRRAAFIMLPVDVRHSHITYAWVSSSHMHEFRGRVPHHICMSFVEVCHITHAWVSSTWLTSTGSILNAALISNVCICDICGSIMNAALISKLCNICRIWLIHLRS